MGLLPDLIETRRLRLRAPVLADAPAILAAYAQDPVVCRFLAWSPHESVAVTQRFIGECLAGWAGGTPLPYVIALPPSNEAQGMIEARVKAGTIDVGYVLARAHWGNGFMPEALAALTSACLARPEIFRVQAVCDTENLASARVLDKAGFTREGRLQRYGVHPNVSPEPRDVYIFARVR